MVGYASSRSRCAPRGQRLRRLRPRADAVAVAAEVHVGVADQVAHAVRAGDGQAVAAARAQHEPAGPCERAVRARDDRRADGDLPRLLEPGAGGLGVHRQLGSSTSCAGVSGPRATARSASCAPTPCPATARARPARVVQEAGEHLGQPLRRVGVVRTVLAVAVQRQVGQHDAVAVRERRPPPARTRGG